MINTQAKYEVK